MFVLVCLSLEGVWMDIFTKISIFAFLLTHSFITLQKSKMADFALRSRSPKGLKRNRNHDSFKKLVISDQKIHSF